MFLTIRLFSAVPRGRPRLGARRTRAPSTITQYEYYSPYSPDGVPKLFGTPPRIVFLHTGFPGVGISWCVFEHHTFRVLFFYTQDSRVLAFHNVFVTIRSVGTVFYAHDTRELEFHGVFLIIARFAYCFLHTGFPGVGIS